MNSKAALKRTIAILGIVSWAFLGGCGGGASALNNQPPPPTPSPPPASGTSGFSWMTVAVASDPTGKFGKFAYVTHSASNNVSMYTINPTTGVLQLIGTVIAGTSPMFVVADPAGKFVYAANQGSNDISVYTINQMTGALQPTGRAAAGESPISLAVDPSSKFAYVANEGSNDISMYKINATTGALEPLGPIPAGVRPTSIATDPSGKFVYAANAELNGPAEVNTSTGNLSMYAIDSTSGVLEALGMIATGMYPRSVAADPSGKFVYVANCGDFERNQGDLAMYSIDGRTGTLISMGTIVAGSCPLAVGLHPSGKFAFAVNTGSDGGPDIEGVSTYTINANGTLTSLGLVGAGYCPSSVAVDPSGEFAYVTNHCDNNISMYAIDATTGVLALIGTIGT